MSRDHVVKVSCDIVRGVFSTLVNILLSLIIIGLKEVEIIEVIISVPIPIPIPIPIPMPPFQCRDLQMARELGGGK